jgi:hypothetical protein
VIRPRLHLLTHMQQKGNGKELRLQPGSKGQNGDRTAMVPFGSKPDNIVPCDGTTVHNSDEFVDMCIEMDLLASAPEHTKVSHMRRKRLTASAVQMTCSMISELT